MPITYTSIASAGGEESFTKSLKPIANHTRKNASGTLIASTSNVAVGEMNGVDWSSRRAPVLQEEGDGGEADAEARDHRHDDDEVVEVVDVVGERRGLLGEEQQAPHELVHAVAPRRFFSFNSCLQSTVSKTTSAAKTSRAPMRMNAST